MKLLFKKQLAFFLFLFPEIPRAMFAFIFTAITTFKVIGFRENHQAIFVKIKVFPFLHFIQMIKLLPWQNIKIN